MKILKQTNAHESMQVNLTRNHKISQIKSKSQNGNKFVCKQTKIHKKTYKITICILMHLYNHPATPR